MLCLGACGGPTGEKNAWTLEAMHEVAKARALGLDPREHGIGQQLPDLSFRDLEGVERQLSECMGATGLVVFMLALDGSEDARLAGTRAGLERELKARGLNSLFVDCSRAAGLESLRVAYASQGLQGFASQDSDGSLRRALGASHSNDCFLLDAQRTLIYRGAADNQHANAAEKPGVVRQHLMDALEAMLAGERPELEASEAQGFPLQPSLGAAREASQAPTYHGEIERIMQRNCVGCHREGGAGPFVLDSLQALKKHGGMLRYMVKERLMPPWLASQDSGPYVGELSLPEADIETLLRWYELGLPAGEPADAPLPRHWSAEWKIGQPDHIFEDREAFVVPAEGIVDLISTYVEVGLQQDIWVDRIQVSASAPQLVHHSSVLIRFPEGHVNDSQAGLREDEDGSVWRFFMAYLPGAGTRVYPNGMGRLVPKGSVLRVVTHYTTTGVETPNRMRIGVSRAKTDPEYVVETRMLRRHDIEIPPGVSELRFDQAFSLPKNVLLYSVTPHMHLRGKRFLAELVQPDGGRQKLIEIPRWDSNWQFSYVPREMLPMPAQARIEYSVWYDNSAANAANPDPSQTVRDGPQIWDEMMQLWVEWIRPRLQGE